MNLALFVTITLVTLILIGMGYIVNFWRRSSFIQTINTLPGPKTFPFIGNVPYFVKLFNKGNKL